MRATSGGLVEAWPCPKMRSVYRYQEFKSFLPLAPSDFQGSAWNTSRLRCPWGGWAWQPSHVGAPFALASHAQVAEGSPCRGRRSCRLRRSCRFRRNCKLQSNCAGAACCASAAATERCEGPLRRHAEVIKQLRRPPWRKRTRKKAEESDEKEKEEEEKYYRYRYDTDEIPMMYRRHTHEIPIPTCVDISDVHRCTAVYLCLLVVSCGVPDRCRVHQPIGF